MKPLSLFQKTHALIALGMSAGLLMSAPGFAEGKPVINIGRGKGDDPAKNNNTKTASSLNNSVIRIYPDPVKKSMHVIAKENEGKEIDFFVFDVNGVIVQNVKMKEKEHIRLSGLNRGKYIYRVFCGDMETANGHFEIR